MSHSGCCVLKDSMKYSNQVFSVIDPAQHQTGNASWEKMVELSIMEAHCFTSPHNLICSYFKPPQALLQQHFPPSLSLTAMTTQKRLAESDVWRREHSDCRALISVVLPTFPHKNTFSFTRSLGDGWLRASASLGLKRGNVWCRLSGLHYPCRSVCISMVPAREPESWGVKEQAEVFSPENPARLEIHVLESD